MDPEPDQLTSFRHLYEQFGQMLYHICLNYLKSPADAEDAVQEVFLRFFEHAGQIEDEPHQKHWLIRTAINYCKDQSKSFWRKHVDLMEVSRISFPTLTEPEEFGLLTAMFQLPEKQSICLYLFYVQELTIPQIANGLGLNQSTVKMRLKRGRDTLRFGKEADVI